MKFHVLRSILDIFVSLPVLIFMSIVSKEIENNVKIEITS